MYVDILLAENLIINYMLLSITSKFLKLKSSKVRLLLSSAVGALYIIVIFFPSLKYLLTVSMKISVSVLMIVIAFAPERFRDLFKILGTFYIIAFLLGGASFSLFYLAGNGNIINGVFYIRNFPVYLLIIAFAIGYLLLVYCWDFVQKRVLNDKLIYNIAIEIGSKKINVKAILDTANSLKDVFFDLPVIVVEYDALHDVLPSNFSHVFQNNCTDIDFNELYRLAVSPEWTLRIRLIPFSSLGKQNGILIGIKPDNVKITTREFTKDTDKVIIGISNDKISNDGQYNALVSPEILK